MTPPMFPAEVQQTNVIDVVDRALARVLDIGASDIHLEPGRTSYSCRLRRDGFFVPCGTIPLASGTRIVSRLKVMARLAVYRTDTPQEGAFPLPGHEGSGRLSIVPTIHGEKVVVRLLTQTSRFERLADLGFEDDVHRALSRLIRLPQGLIMVTGPSGSGKTTSLYACVREILEDQGSFRSIASLEDPVECTLEGVSQTEVHPDRGLTFPQGLKALLRQDPEILMIGEIRDAQTAQIAVQAGLTGHLVLTSLHAPSATEALTRMWDLGIGAGLCAAAIRGILCQRLFPTPCRDHETVGVDRCSTCRGTGIHGRRAVGELLELEGALRDQVRRGIDPTLLAQEAAALGYRPLRERVETLVRNGTLSGEHARVLMGDPQLFPASDRSRPDPDVLTLPRDGATTHEGDLA